MPKHKGPWNDALYGVIGKFKVGAAFGEVTFNKRGCEAMLYIIQDMADRLDGEIAARAAITDVKVSPKAKEALLNADFQEKAASQEGIIRQVEEVPAEPSGGGWLHRLKAGARSFFAP